MAPEFKREKLTTLFSSAPVILTDGGIETRLMYEFGIALPEFRLLRRLVRRGAARGTGSNLSRILAIAVEFRRSMQVGTLTWRAIRPAA